MIHASSPVAATRSPLRWERASLAATVSVLGSVVAHVVGNGGMPSVGAVAVAWLVTWLGAAQLGRTRLTWPLLAALSLLAQVTLHVTWMLSHPATSTHDFRMVAGHVLAAITSVVVAGYGEAAVWRTAELLGLQVFWWRPWSADTEIPQPASGIGPTLLLTSPWWPGPAPGRAPPVV